MADQLVVELASGMMNETGPPREMAAMVVEIGVDALVSEVGFPTVVVAVAGEACPACGKVPRFT